MMPSFPKRCPFRGKSGVDVPLAVDGKDIVQSGHNPQGFLDFLCAFMYLDRTPATFARTVDAVTDSVAKAWWDNARRLLQLPSSPHGRGRVKRHKYGPNT